MCGCLSCAPLLRMWPTTQAFSLIGNWTSHPLVLRLEVNPLSHISQGHFCKFLENVNQSTVTENLSAIGRGLEGHRWRHRQGGLQWPPMSNLINYYILNMCSLSCQLYLNKVVKIQSPARVSHYTLNLKKWDIM